MKTFHEYLAEADCEITTEIVTAFDPSPYLKDIEAVVMKHGLCCPAEVTTSKGLSARPAEFPTMAMAEVHKVKVITKSRPTASALQQEIASKCRVDQSLVTVKIDGDEAKGRPTYEPDFGKIVDALSKSTELNFDADKAAREARKLAGQDRISDLLADLATRASETEKHVAARTKAVMTHLGLTESTGEIHRKGYYKVSFDRKGKLLEKEGPFAERPAGRLIESFAKLNETHMDLSRGLASLGFVANSRSSHETYYSISRPAETQSVHDICISSGYDMITHYKNSPSQRMPNFKAYEKEHFGQRESITLHWVDGNPAMTMGVTYQSHPTRD